MKLINNTALVFGLGLLLSVACGKSEDGGGDGDGSGGTNLGTGGSASGGAGDGTASGGRFQTASGGGDGTGDGGGGGLGGGPGGGGNGDPADVTTCDEVDEPCCEAAQGPAQCGNGLSCEGFGPQASCQQPPDTTACDTAGDPCCEGSGFGPGICAEGLVCEREGTGPEATTSCVLDTETDPSEVDTTECDEVGDACCTTGGQGPNSNVCGNDLECAWGGQGVGRVCAEPE